MIYASTRRSQGRWHIHEGWYALAAAIGLTVIGIEAIRTNDAQNAFRQTIWFAVALVVCGLCVWPRPRTVGLYAYGLLAGALFLLVLLILPWTPAAIVPRTNAAKSWIDLRIMRVQPSELAKVAFVLAMAWYLRHRESYRTLRGLLVPLAISLVPVVMILSQPDLGTALLFLPTVLVMLIAAGAKLRHIGGSVGISLALVAVLVATIYLAPNLASLALRPHQQNRFKALISMATGDERHNDSLAFQQIKSIQLIGAGQIFGYGAARSARFVRALPEAHNDMIYAVIINRWGLLGGLVVLGLCMVVVLMFAMVAGRSKDPFSRLVVVGFAGLLFTQAAIHLAVNLGLLPVTGITLPFVSYGGSSLVVTFSMVGLVINIAGQDSLVPSRPSFEFAG